MQRANYTIEQVVDTFVALTATLHYNAELDLLSVPRWRFNKRRKLKRELGALDIALWRLALNRSFPDDHDLIFQSLMERRQKAEGSSKGAELVLSYVEKLRPSGDGDFSVVAQHLLHLARRKSELNRSLVLRLALHIRHRYMFFFQNLVHP